MKSESGAWLQERKPRGWGGIQDAEFQREAKIKTQRAINTPVIIKVSDGIAHKGLLMLGNYSWEEGIAQSVRPQSPSPPHQPTENETFSSCKCYETIAGG